MKKSKSIKLIVAGLVGCGFCCFLLLFPAATGIIGLTFLDLSAGALLCGLLVLMIVLASIWLYLNNKKKACVPAAGD